MRLTLGEEQAWRLGQRERQNRGDQAECEAGIDEVLRLIADRPVKTYANAADYGLLHEPSNLYHGLASAGEPLTHVWNAYVQTSGCSYA